MSKKNFWRDMNQRLLFETLFINCYNPSTLKIEIKHQRFTYAIQTSTSLGKNS